MNERSVPLKNVIMITIALVPMIASVIFYVFTNFTMTSDFNKLQQRVSNNEIQFRTIILEAQIISELNSTHNTIKLNNLHLTILYKQLPINTQMINDLESSNNILKIKLQTLRSQFLTENIKR